MVFMYLHKKQKFLNSFSFEKKIYVIWDVQIWNLIADKFDDVSIAIIIGQTEPKMHAFHTFLV